MAKYTLRNNKRVAMTAEEESQWNILVEQSAIEKAEYDALEYQRKRAKEYPPIGDQLDYIYHNGLTKWKADMITPVKEKYPKPD